MKSVCVNVCILILTFIALTHQGLIQPPLRNNDIVEGNCANATDQDRVFYDHVDKAGFPLVVRSETETYDGNGIIYCIKALNQKSTETGGTAVITKGGVHFSFVTIELESFRGHGLEYYVYVYAK